MEKPVSVAVTNKKVCNFFRHDLVLFILSKLPLKSLKQFQCVCKSWSLLFKNRHFINMYFNHLTRDNHSYHDDTFLVLHKLIPEREYESWHAHFYWFSTDKFENWVKLDWPSQFKNDDCNIYIVGSASVNGILCLKQGLRAKQLVLWNPTTAETKLIPPSPVENRPSDRNPWFFLHGFGYDHVSDDYKVVQMTDFFPDEIFRDENGDASLWEIYSLKTNSWNPLWEIYSLKTNSWKKLDFDLRNCYDYSALRSIGVYMDGFSHWWASTVEKNVEENLLSFDFSTEMLIKTPMPTVFDDRFDHHAKRNLVMLNGSIAMISNYPKPDVFGISILGKLGVRESWINLFIVGSLPFVEFPIGVGKSNNVVFSNEDYDQSHADYLKSSSIFSFDSPNKSVWVDLRTQILRLLSVNGEKLDRCQMGKYKKSFDPIGRINS